MRALILADGDAPSAAFMGDLASRHDLVIATDGAVHKALDRGVRPHIVCGDFDSADVASARAALPDAEFITLADQDYTDLEKTIRLALTRGATAITLAGALGGRIDHALASIAVLLRYHDQANLRIAGEGFDVFVVSGAKEISTTPGDTISLLAFSEGIRVSIAGVKWPLENHPLEIGTHGVSNIALGTSVQLNVRGGPLIVCRLTSSLREA